jgi:hypothetical protein
VRQMNPVRAMLAGILLACGLVPGCVDAEGARCSSQCKTLNACLALHVDENPESVSSAAEGNLIQAGEWEPVIDHDVCVERCLYRVEAGDNESYRGCAEDAQAGLDKWLESSTNTQARAEALRACDQLLNSNCARDDHGVCSATPGRGPGLFALFLLLAAAVGTRLLRRCGNVRARYIVAAAVASSSGASAARPAKVGSGNFVEVGVGYGYVTPDVVKPNYLRAIPFLGAMISGSDRVAPGPYLEANLGLDSNVIGIGGKSGGPVGLDLKYLASLVSNSILAQQSDEDTIAVGGNEIGYSQIAGALRIRIDANGYWTNEAMYGQFSGAKPRAIGVAGIHPPYGKHPTIAGSETGWAGTHLRLRSLYRVGTVATETVGAGGFGVGVQMTRERPVVFDIGVQYEALELPVHDFSQRNSIAKYGGTLRLTSDPALNQRASTGLDYFFGFRFGAGYAEMEDVTFSAEGTDAEDLGYFEFGLDLGLTAVFARGRRSHWFTRLAYHYELTGFWFEPNDDDFALVAVRSMLTLGYLY